MNSGTAFPKDKGLPCEGGPYISFHNFAHVRRIIIEIVCQ